jgi:hypothetical protein
MAVHTHELLRPPARSRWLIGGYLVGGLAAAVHVLQLAALVPPFAVYLDWAHEWPHKLHLWLLSGLCWLGVVVALVGRRYSARWHRGWASQSPLSKALRLVMLLLAVQLMLCLGFWLTWPYGVDQLGWLRAFFFLGDEYRPASLFAASQLWLVAWLAWCCYQRERHGAWLFAAFICTYLGLDEWFSIHEWLGIAARQVDSLHAGKAALGAQGLTVYGWQLVMLPVVVVVGAALLRAFMRITTWQELALLVAGAAVFLGGAMGFESVEAAGVHTDPAYWASARAHAVLLAEEAMEMLGVAIVVGVFAHRCFARTPGT